MPIPDVGYTFIPITVHVLIKLTEKDKTVIRTWRVKYCARLILYNTFWYHRIVIHLCRLMSYLALYSRIAYNPLLEVAYIRCLNTKQGEDIKLCNKVIHLPFVIQDTYIPTDYTKLHTNLWQCCIICAQKNWYVSGLTAWSFTMNDVQ